MLMLFFLFLNFSFNNCKYWKYSFVDETNISWMNIYLDKIINKTIIEILRDTKQDNTGGQQNLI